MSKEKMDLDTLKDFVDVLGKLGEITEKIGNIEKKTGRPLDLSSGMLELLKTNLPTIEKMFARKPEAVSKLVTVFLKLLTLSPKMSKKMDEIPPDDKIEIGRALKDVANSLNEIFLSYKGEEK